MPNPLSVTLHAMGVEAGVGATAAVDIGPLRTAARLLLDISAESPALSFEVSVETSPSGVSWRTAGAFPSLSSPSSVRIAFGGLEQLVRVRWAFGGPAPSAAFAVSGSALVSYATIDDLHTLGVPARALAAVSDGDKIESLLAASSVADSRLRKAVTLPLLAWGDDLRRAVVHIAVYDLMVTRGFQPTGADELIEKRYLDAIAWLKDVAHGDAVPDELVDSTPLVDELEPVIETSAERGWGARLFQPREPVDEI